MANYNDFNYDYGIPQLRKKNLFDRYSYSDPPSPGIGMPKGDEEINVYASPDPNEINVYAQPDVPLNPPPQIPQVGFNQPAQQNDDTDMEGLINRMYKPETAANDAFMQAIKNQPTGRQPNVFNRIGATLTGIASGPAAAQKQLHARDDNEMADWKAGIEPKYQAASLERQGNINARQTAAIAAQGKMNEDKLASQERIAQARNDIQRLKNEGWTFDTKSGPYVIGTNPKGETKIFKDVPTGKLSELEKENIEWTGRKDVAQIGATSRENIVNTQGGTARAVAGINAKAGIDKAEIGKEATLGAAEIRGPNMFGGGRQNPRDDDVRRNQRYRDAYNNNPDLQRWYRPATSAEGNWLMAPPPIPPGRFEYGGDARYAKEKAEYDRARSLVGADTTSTSPPPPTNTQQPPPRVGNRTPSPQVSPSATTGLGPQPGSPVLGGSAPQVPDAVKQQQAADIAAGRKVVLTNDKGEKRVYPNTPEGRAQAAKERFR